MLSYRAARVCGMRLLALSGLWWLLAGNAPGSWLFGAPVIVSLSAWRFGADASHAFPLRPWRLATFIPFFVWRSLLGSCDVAWRAMHQELPIAPTIYDYDLRLPAGSPARVFFANCINLVPGTLTASWEGDVLRVHVLLEGPRILQELRTLEGRIALLFDHSMAPTGKDLD